MPHPPKGTAEGSVVALGRVAGAGCRANQNGGAPCIVVDAMRGRHGPGELRAFRGPVAELPMCGRYQNLLDGSEI